MEVIRTNELTKSFGNTRAVDNISIHVKQGEIYGFLGLNGAGKTTLIRMLLGMIQPDKGEMKLFGQTVKPGFRLWNEIGYLVETPSAYPNLSVYENLRVFYKLRQLSTPSAVDDIIEQLKLGKYRNIKAKALSLGNQQRLGLAKALMHKPKLLLLDEPINGLDPEGIVEVRTLLKTLAENGSTIFLSSHILNEISKVANRIGIIHEGRLIKELTIEELTQQIIKKILIRTTHNQKALQYLQQAGYDCLINENTNEIEALNQKALDAPEQMTMLLAEKGCPPQQIYLYTEDLEMFFLRTIKGNHS